MESSDAVLTSCSGRGEAGYLIGRELSLKVDMAGSSNGADIILPNDVRYIGSRVTLYNGCHPPYTRTVALSATAPSVWTTARCSAVPT